MFVIHVETIYLALFSAGLSMFLEFGFRDKNILSFWLDFWGDLYKFIFPYKVPSESKMADESEGTVTTEREYKIWKAWKITKPLGYCIVCFNVWVSLAVFFFYDFQNWTQVIVYFILSNLIVRFVHDKLI